MRSSKKTEKVEQTKRSKMYPVLFYINFKKRRRKTEIVRSAILEPRNSVIVWSHRNQIKMVYQVGRDNEPCQMLPRLGLADEGKNMEVLETFVEGQLIEWKPDKHQFKAKQKKTLEITI